MTETKKRKKRGKYKKGLKADYKGATPEQVARVLHQHRPNQMSRKGG